MKLFKKSWTSIEEISQTSPEDPRKILKKTKGIIAGSFDLIHPGYVRMFRDSKESCDCLIVALQGDPTIDRPSKCRPVQSLEDRLEILQSIRYIDEILVYNTELELKKLLSETDHDFRILGTDYKDKDYTGRDLKKPVLWIQRDHSYSTTSLKDAICAERCESRKKNKVD